MDREPLLSIPALHLSCDGRQWSIKLRTLTQNETSTTTPEYVSLLLRGRVGAFALAACNQTSRQPTRVILMLYKSKRWTVTV